MMYAELVDYYQGLGIRDERARFMALTHYWYQEKADAERSAREIKAMMGSGPTETDHLTAYVVP